MVRGSTAWQQTLEGGLQGLLELSSPRVQVRPSTPISSKGSCSGPCA